MKFYIIGSDGYIGARVADQLKTNHQIVRIDVCEQSLISSISDGVIINCAIDRSDYKSTLKLVKYLISRGRPIIQLSSHLVEAKRNSPYKTYLNQLEKLFKTLPYNKKWTLIRLIRPVGGTRNGNANLANALLHSFNHHARLHLPDDDPFMVSDIHTVVDTIVKIASNQSMFNRQVCALLGSVLDNEMLTQSGIRTVVDRRYSHILESYSNWYLEADKVIFCPICRNTFYDGIAARGNH